ncbi:MAG: hypothetical protein O3C10_06285 [Chloroflexi bacterium]|nr:hypothetical protein [Chloroflexota bacterium]
MSEPKFHEEEETEVPESLDIDQEAEGSATKTTDDGVINEKPIGELAARIEATTGFDLNQAKVIAYYAVVTHGVAFTK